MTVEDGAEPIRIIPGLGYKPLIGVIHLPPVASMHRDGASVEVLVEYAVSEARKLEEAGFDGVIVENYGDKPYRVEWSDYTLASTMSVVVREVVKATSLVVGVNVLRNDVLTALAAAYAGGARFIRVNSYCELRASPEGLLLPEAARIADAASRLGRAVMVFADVDVKHSVSVVEKAERLIAECPRRGVADAFIVSGSATGEAPPPGYVAALRTLLSPYPIILGSGLTLGNIRNYWSIVDGFIVGSSIKEKGTETVISLNKAAKLAELVRSLRRDLERFIGV